MNFVKSLRTEPLALDGLGENELLAARAIKGRLQAQATVEFLRWAAVPAFWLRPSQVDKN